MAALVGSMDWMDGCMGRDGWIRLIDWMDSIGWNGCMVGLGGVDCWIGWMRWFGWDEWTGWNEWNVMEMDEWIDACLG